MRIDYQLRFDDGQEIHLPLNFDRSMRLRWNPQNVWPEWTDLKNHQCHVCPLGNLEGLRCPAAIGMHILVEPFAARSIHEEALCEVRTPQRSYRARVPLGVALGSALGLVLATSGCPVLDHLRPMAYLHIPFASASETYLRNAALALYAQFVRKQNGLSGELNLDAFHGLSATLGEINRHLSERLKDTDGQAQGSEAMFLLDLFAQSGMRNQDSVANSVEELFTAWTESPKD